MTDSNFSELSKALSTSTTRGTALKLFGATAAGSVMTLFGAGRASAAAPGRCRQGGSNCRQSAECCSGFCDPTTATCACGPGTFECTNTGICVGPCGPGQVFNAATCQCECPTGAAACGQTCCAPGQVCANGACCINPLTCTATTECCGGFRCTGSAKGPGTCVPCTNPPSCKSSTQCCSGYVCAAPGVCTPVIA